MKRNWLMVALFTVATPAIAWYGGSSYTPSYEGRAGAGYITPSRFAPRAYNKNTGWNSTDKHGRCAYTNEQTYTEGTRKKNSIIKR